MGALSAITYDYDLDVLIVGAGFSGIYQLHKYRLLNLRAKIFEAGSNLGGVWFWHNFPGARVDIPVPMYEFSSEDLWKEWYWSERYPSQKELRSYFEHVEKKLDVKKDVCFDTRVTSAHFNAGKDRWIIITENGVTAQAKFLCLCLGFGSKPYIPDLPNLSSFRGSGGIIHSARWPRDGADMKGKRVGVIGTGASGVQIIQTLASLPSDESPKRLTIFQRTPNLAIPMRQEKLDRVSQDKAKALYPMLYRRRRQTAAGLSFDRYPKNFFDASPEERLLLLEDLWQTGGFSFLFANFNDILTDRVANEEVYAFWRRKVRERLKNPDLHEKLAPTIPPHALGAKRSSLEQCYYDVYNQDNVELVDIMTNPVVEITRKGVKTADGIEHELDALILATGYDSVTGGITQIDIRGIDGTSIKEKWQDGVYTYLGLTSAGFPNLFFVYGPQGPTAVCSGPTCAETEGDWIVSCIKTMLEQNVTRIEATHEAEVAWRQQVISEASTRLISTARSWYVGANVKNKKVEILMYTGGAAKYTQICQEVADGGYEGFTLSSTEGNIGLIHDKLN
ncbi:cyclohexanone monooxygenase [Lentinula edodes]|uniref:L-ornithine N(5)-monooxygenase [NAD(P)H] n=1 Tax=Lentinula lateritia TaxID=40482 RepID=A0A9W9E0Q5_9AGAR|nr:cyclohexanone monooxygenase [Lentinula edodes]